MKRTDFEKWIRENAREFEVTKPRPATLRYRVTIDFLGEKPIIEDADCENCKAAIEAVKRPVKESLTAVEGLQDNK